MSDQIHVQPFTNAAKPGSRVHLGLQVVDPKVMRGPGGRGVVTLCGIAERHGGSWQASVTERPADCQDCLEVARKSPQVEAPASALPAPVALVAVDLAVWDAEGFATELATYDELSRRIDTAGRYSS